MFYYDVILTRAVTEKDELGNDAIVGHEPIAYTRGRMTSEEHTILDLEGRAVTKKVYKLVVHRHIAEIGTADTAVIHGVPYSIEAIETIPNRAAVVTLTGWKDGGN